jgi:hypothetical protein
MSVPRNWPIMTQPACPFNWRSMKLYTCMYCHVFAMPNSVNRLEFAVKLMKDTIFRHKVNSRVDQTKWPLTPLPDLPLAPSVIPTLRDMQWVTRLIAASNESFTSFYFRIAITYRSLVRGRSTLRQWRHLDVTDRVRWSDGATLN